MDSRTLSALERSIKHWEENLAAAREGLPGGVSYSANDCALCGEFYDGNCIGCPIAERTGKNTCADTPYYQVDAWLDEYYDSEYPGQPDILDLIAACQAEVDFLKSLLPVKESSNEQEAGN